jgi:hypothetical protein
VKDLRRKKHEKPKYGLGAATAEEAQTKEKGEDEEDSNDSDFAPREKKGWMAKIESKFKQVVCF